MSQFYLKKSVLTITGRKLSFSRRHGHSGRNITDNFYVLGENKND